MVEILFGKAMDNTTISNIYSLPNRKPWLVLIYNSFANIDFLLHKPVKKIRRLIGILFFYFAKA